MARRGVSADDYLIIIIIIIIYIVFFIVLAYIFLVDGVFHLLIFCVCRLFKQHAPNSNKILQLIHKTNIWINNNYISTNNIEFF